MRQGIVTERERAGALLDALIVAGCIGMVLVGIAMSPEALARLGPMRASLQSPLDSVQQIARAEVAVLRVASIVLGVAVGTTWLAWPRLRQLPWVERLAGHVPVVRPMPWSASTVLGPPLLLIAGGVLGVLLLVVHGPAWLGQAAFDAVVVEDGLVEQATAGLFLLAAVAAAAAACRWRVWPYRIVLGLMAVGFLLCVGEEISWGQRVLGFATPAALQEVNVQGEANLHNSLGYAADHLFIAGVLALGFVLPALAALFDMVRNAADRLGLPVASPSLALGFLLVSLLHDWIVYRLLPPSGLRLAEARELLSALALLMLMIEACRNAATARRPW